MLGGWKAGDEVRTRNIQLGRREGQNSNCLQDQLLTDVPQGVCTPVCTSNAESVNAGPVDRVAALAAHMAGLTPTDRQRLVQLLAGLGDHTKDQRG